MQIDLNINSCKDTAHLLATIVIYLVCDDEPKLLHLLLFDSTGKIPNRRKSRRCHHSECLGSSDFSCRYTGERSGARLVLENSVSTHPRQRSPH